MYVHIIRKIYRVLKRLLSLPYLLTLPVTVVLAALLIYPLMYAIYLSFYSTGEGLAHAKFVGLANFKNLLFSPVFWIVSKNTTIFVISTVFVPFFIGLVIAQLLESINRGVKIFRIIFILPLAVTPVVTGQTWNMMLNPGFGIVNYLLGLLGIRDIGWATDINTALFTVIFVEIWQWTPFMTIVLYAGFQMLPKDPFEAALIDGATYWQKFIYIGLPLLKPAIIIALILRLTDAFKSFDVIYTITKGGPGHASETMVIRAYLQSFPFYHLEYGVTIGIIMLLISIVACKGIIKFLPK